MQDSFATLLFAFVLIAFIVLGIEGFFEAMARHADMIKHFGGN